jgi:hypothetical protein
MSSHLRNSSTDGDEPNAARRYDGVAEHPRGTGFRVLSQLARHRAEEEAYYAPRHRSAALVESDDPTSRSSSAP